MGHPAFARHTVIARHPAFGRSYSILGAARSFILHFAGSAVKTGFLCLGWGFSRAGIRFRACRIFFQGYNQDAVLRGISPGNIAHRHGKVSL
jgi:hypothetical protein